MISQHPGVAAVGVIGVPDEKWGEAVKAVVVKREGADVDPDELKAMVKEKKGAVYTPKSVDFIDALPRNPSGKVLRRELRKPYWEGRGRQVG